MLYFILRTGYKCKRILTSMISSFIFLNGKDLVFHIYYYHLPKHLSNTCFPVVMSYAVVRVYLESLFLKVKMISNRYVISIYIILKAVGEK